MTTTKDYKTRNVRVAIDKATWERFKELTQGNGEQTSKVIASYIETHLETHRTQS